MPADRWHLGSCSAPLAREQRSLTRRPRPAVAVPPNWDASMARRIAWARYQTSRSRAGSTGASIPAHKRVPITSPLQSAVRMLALNRCAWSTAISVLELLPVGYPRRANALAKLRAVQAQYQKTKLRSRRAPPTDAVGTRQLQRSLDSCAQKQTGGLPQTKADRKDPRAERLLLDTRDQGAA
jgi:hypothetical protein